MRPILHDAARFKAETLLLHRVDAKIIFAHEATSQCFFSVFRYAGHVGVYKSWQPTAPVCHIKSPGMETCRRRFSLVDPWDKHQVTQRPSYRELEQRNLLD